MGEDTWPSLGDSGKMFQGMKKLRFSKPKWRGVKWEWDGADGMYFST